MLAAVVAAILWQAPQTTADASATSPEGGETQAERELAPMRAQDFAVEAFVESERLIPEDGAGAAALLGLQLGLLVVRPVRARRHDVLSLVLVVALAGATRPASRRPLPLLALAAAPVLSLLLWKPALAGRGRTGARAASGARR